MSTDYYFNFDSKKFRQIKKFLINHPLRLKTDFGIEFENKHNFFAFGRDNNFNGMWINIARNGCGSMTRYAGTSLKNFNDGFKILNEIYNFITPIKEFLSEHELE